MKNIKQIKTVVLKNLQLFVAVQFVAILVLSVFVFQANASAGQMTSRSIEMSDSSPSGGSIASGVGSGTKVAYKVTFTPTVTTAVGGIVIDFCSNSALVGDTCTAPTAFNVNRATTAVQAGQSAGCGTGAFATYTSDATNNRIIITRGSPALTSGACSFDLGDGVASTGNGFTNPSTVGTFYARIYTYGTAAAAQGHTTASPSGYIDNGGAALSTANIVTITTRVQENLTFCISLANPTANCGGTSAPAITLGHGTVPRVDSTQVDAGTAYSQISTNASSGAIVRMHSAYACGGLSADSGTTCGIPAAGSGAATSAALTAGTAAFGVSVLPSFALAGGSGTVTPDANYYNSGHVTYGTANNATPALDMYFGMDTTTSGNNTVTTYGDTIMACTTPVSNINNQLAFAATASNITPAGLYQNNLSMIATGTF